MTRGSRINPHMVPPLRLQSNVTPLQKGEYLISGVTDVAATQRVVIPLDGSIERGALRRAFLVLKTINTAGTPPNDMNTILLDTDEAIPLIDLDLENRIYRSNEDPSPGGFAAGIPGTIIDEVLPEEVEFQTKGGGVGVRPPATVPDTTNKKGGFIQVVFEFDGGSGYDYDFILQIFGDALG